MLVRIDGRTGSYSFPAERLISTSVFFCMGKLLLSKAIDPSLDLSATKKAFKER